MLGNHLKNLFLIIGLVLITLLISNQTFASEQSISDADYKAIIEDLQQVSNTNEDGLYNYEPKAITSQSIRSLFNDPRISEEPSDIRYASLMAAGKAGALSFQKPSDILSLMKLVFPNEINAAKKYYWIHKIQLPFGYIQGSFSDWNDESTAFVALWTCMPIGAWFDPSKDAVVYRGNGMQMLGIYNAQYNGTPYLGFTRCLKGVSAIAADEEHRDFTNTVEGRKQLETTVKRYQKHITRVVSDKFFAYLSKQQCTNTGPDDCLLSLMLWSEIAPEDKRMVDVIKKYESDLVFLNSKIFNRSADRALAFIDSKLKSMIHAPELWRDDEINDEIQRIIALTKNKSLNPDSPSRRYFYDAWAKVEDLGVNLQRANIVISNLLKLDQSSCAIRGMFLNKDNPITNLFILNKYSSGVDEEPCASFSWGNLISQNGEIGDRARDMLTSLTNNTKSGKLRDYIISNFVNEKGECVFTENETAWGHNFCIQHKPLPMLRSLISQDHTLDLTSQKKFHLFGFEVDTNSQGEVTNDKEHIFLEQLSKGVSAKVILALKDFFSRIYDNGNVIISVNIWKHPNHSRALASIVTTGKNSDGLPDPQGYLYVITPNELIPLGIPSRFYHIDGEDAQYKRNSITEVSDIDNDGNLEIWFGYENGECQKNASDLDRDVQCNLIAMNAGEIDSGHLSSFKDNHNDKVTAPHNEGFNVNNMNFPLPDANMSTQSHASNEQPCNYFLVKTSLSTALNISFGEGDDEYGDIVDITCKPHPKDSNHTIIALFSENHDEDSTSSDSQEREFSLIVAVADLNKESILNIFQTNYEEDATIRISEYSLKIDTARYNLAPNIRAFGVRANISYSPRYAEGGDSDYLSLFIEDGKKLNRVLTDYPTSLWEIANHDSSCIDSDDGCLTEVTSRYVSIAPSITNGLHDLTITSISQLDCEQNCTKSDSTTAKYILKFKNNQYQ